MGGRQPRDGCRGQAKGPAMMTHGRRTSQAQKQRRDGAITESGCKEIARRGGRGGMEIGADCRKDGPLKAATTLFRSAARAEAEAEGGPPEDGAFVEGWLILGQSAAACLRARRSADGASRRSQRSRGRRQRAAEAECKCARWVAGGGPARPGRRRAWCRCAVDDGAAAC